MFNRGFRRDDRNNSFRSNTNMSRGQNAPSLMSVSPWEAGVVPGSGGSSILGTPHNMQNTQNLLTPQAAALAQNLNILSNLGLLQSQLQPRQPQGLPSLVNLGSALNRSIMGQQSNYRQMNQPFNRGGGGGGGGNRFQDQRPKYVRQDGRRTEPFNKNRPRPSQSQTNQQKLQSYRPLNSKVPALQAARKSASQGGDALAKARADVRGKRLSMKKEAKKSGLEQKAGDDDAKKEEGEEIEKKRDWKKEKKSDVIEIDDDEDKKTNTVEKMEGVVEDGKSNGDLSLVKTEDESNDVVEVEEDEEGKEEDKDKTEKTGEEKKKGQKPNEATIYNCHVCTKKMWDERSLNNHLRGAAHKRMMAQLEETYALKVKRIRQQMRLNEDQKDLDMENQRSRGRRVNILPRGHCKMCDLTFFGNIATHRKTALHLKLKNFLHPNCVPCGKEFPARMEWDLHKLTIPHLKVVGEIEKKRKINQEFRAEPNYTKLVPKFPEGLDSVVADMKQEAADKALPDATEDQGEDGESKKDQLTYNPELPAGISMLVHGQHCGVCNKFFSKRPDAIEHCKTRTHFDNFIAMKAKVKAEAEEAEKVAKAALEAAAEAAAAAAAEAAATAAAAAAAAAEETSITAPEEGEAASVTLETSTTDANTELLSDSRLPVLCLKRTNLGTDEGNWKRRRSSKNDEEEDEEEDEEKDTSKGPEVVNITDEESLPNKDETEVDKYNPLEPTSPTPSAEVSLLDSSMDLLQAVEADIDNSDTEKIVTTKLEEQSPTGKVGNKARRGRKRK